MNGILTNILGAGALWTALSGIAGAGIGYYSGTYKDDTQLIIELIKNNQSNEEKLKIIDELIVRGLLRGVRSSDVEAILEKNAEKNPTSVPQGLVC